MPDLYSKYGVNYQNTYKFRLIIAKSHKNKELVHFLLGLFPFYTQYVVIILL